MVMRRRWKLSALVPERGGACADGDFMNAANSVRFVSQQDAMIEGLDWGSGPRGPLSRD
jgi:hypothetical protein